MVQLQVRPEQSADAQAIRHVNIQAFESDAEANLVEVLRAAGIKIISLVAVSEDKIVGHILFSPVSLIENEAVHSIIALAPMAVLPEWQNKGVGSQLVEAGLRYCEEAGYTAVVVLGHPHYYPRFGFEAAVRYNLRCEYPVADDVFMVKELQPGALDGVAGTIKYHDAFNQVT